MVTHLAWDGDPEQIGNSLDDSLWFWRHQPPVNVNSTVYRTGYYIYSTAPVNADGEVLQEPLMLADLGLEAGVGNAGLGAGGGVLVQGIIIIIIIILELLALSRHRSSFLLRSKLFWLVPLIAKY